MKKILVTPRSLTKEGDPALELLIRDGFELVFSAPITISCFEDNLGYMGICTSGENRTHNHITGF